MRKTAIPRTIDGVTYPTTARAVETMRDWLKSLPVGEPLYGHDLDLARELLSRVDESPDPAPISFSVAEQFAGGRELRYSHAPIEYDDGTRRTHTAISIPKAVSGVQHSGPQPMKILRAAVQDQRDAFVQKRMREFPVCDICSCVILEHDADADHVRPFVDIANEWLSFGPNQWAKTARGGYGFARRADEFFWQRHHRNAATWRLLHRECHRKHSAQQARERAAA